MNVTLRRLEHRDINLLRELRNANAKAFFDEKSITREMQEDWWVRYGSNYQLNVYTIWLNSVTPVGFLSVKLLGDMSNIEIRELGHLLLAPAHRGRGIMAAALTEARRLYSPLTFWIAHVKKGNAASLRLFKRAGFVAIKPKKGNHPCPRQSSSTPMRRITTRGSDESAAS